MPEPCEQCGQPIPDASPLGICPRCCFTASFDDQTNGLIEGIELGELIGKGSFGEVYAGVQTDYSLREVAVKIMKDSGVERGRFLEEMQILALLKHRNIAQLFTSGETRDGRPYYAMELVTGLPLDEYEGERLPLMIQLAEAVSHAHRLGIVHRDLKPSNILVEPDGTVKVIDFGIARVISGPISVSHALTQGMRLGTPLYMSPEQLEGDPSIDTLTDVYALGLLFYELCLGHPALRGVVSPEHSWSENARRLEDFTFPRLSPREYDWVARKACAFDRAERYLTVDAFRSDLQSIEKGTMVSAGHKNRGYLAKRFFRKYRTTITVTGLIMLLLSAITGMSLRMAQREQQATAEISESMDQLREAEIETRIAASDSRLREANLALGRDQSAQALGIVDLALELYPENEEATYFRNFLLATRSFAKPLPAPSFSEKVSKIENHPEGFRITFEGGKTQLLPQKTMQLSHRKSDIQISDDHQGGLTFSSQSTGESLLSPLIYGSGSEHAVVSLEHGRVASTTVDGTLKLWDISKLRSHAAREKFSNTVSWLTFERGKDTLWLLDQKAAVFCWPTARKPFKAIPRLKIFQEDFFKTYKIHNQRDYLWTFWQGGNQRGLADGISQSLVALVAMDLRTKLRGTSLMISTMARDKDTVVVVDSAGAIGIRNAIGTHDYLPGPEVPVKRITLSAKGELGAAILKNGELITFSPGTRQILKRWQTHTSLRSITFLDSCDLLIAGGDDGRLHFYDPLTGNETREAINTRAKSTEVVAVPHRDEFLMRSDGDLHLKRWHAHTGKLLHSGMRHQDGVLWFSCSLDGKFLFSIDQKVANPTQGALRVWSLRSGQEIVPALTHPAPLTCATIYENGRRIATASADGNVRRWSITRE